MGVGKEAYAHTHSDYSRSWRLNVNMWMTKLIITFDPFLEINQGKMCNSSVFQKTCPRKFPGNFTILSVQIKRESFIPQPAFMVHSVQVAIGEAARTHLIVGECIDSAFKSDAGGQTPRL